MKSAQTHPTPQHVYEAIQVVAGWCQEIDAVEVLVAPTGGAAFHAERYFDQFSRACAEIERLEADRTAFAEAYAALRAAEDEAARLGEQADVGAVNAAKQAFHEALGRLL